MSGLFLCYVRLPVRYDIAGLCKVLFEFWPQIKAFILNKNTFGRK